jgi:AraC-like DNA-binding protein
MKIETFKPKNKELQKYIESYYILTHSKNEEKVSYLTFPTLFSVIAIVSNAENIINPNGVTTQFCPSKPLETSLVCRFNKPICFQYQGDIKEVCIYFKPLGLNAFLENPLEAYSNSHFDPFIPFPDYTESMIALLKVNDKSLLVSGLEAYWLKKLIGFEHPFLSDAVNRIGERPSITSSYLANEYGVSQKTFIKHFKRHLCKTPTEYKKILRFRRALLEMQLSDKTTKLTELSYITSFFDQSHMVSNFKMLTGLSPKKFFKNLSTIEKSNIHWIFNNG